MLCSRVVGEHMPTGFSNLQQQVGKRAKEKGRMSQYSNFLPPTREATYSVESLQLKTPASGASESVECSRSAQANRRYSWAATQGGSEWVREMRCIKIWFGPATPFHAVTEGLCLVSDAPRGGMAVGSGGR